MKRRILLGISLLLLSGLAITTLGAFLHVRALARQSKVRTEAAPKGGTYYPGGDCEIFTQEQGAKDAPLVLFVGGTGAWSENWKAEMSEAASLGFRALAMDLPPFGYSTKPEGNYSRQAQAARIVALVKSLEASRVVLVGHSFGSAPLLTAAAQMPGKVAAAMVIDPALGWTTPDATKAEPAPAWLRTVFETPWIRLPLAAVATHPRLQKTLLQRVLYRKEMATREVVEVFARQMDVQGKSDEMSRWLGDFLSILDPELIESREFYRSLTVPVTVLWGDRDDITPLWQGERLVELLPRAKLVVIPGVGHVPQVEDPPAFRRELRAFLQSVKIEQRN